MCFICCQDKQRSFPLQYYVTDFKRIRLSCEKHLSFLQIPLSFCLSVRSSARPPVCISAAATEKISMIFDIGDLYGNLSRKSKLHPERTKISGRLHEKAVPLQAWRGPEGSRKLRSPDFVTTAQDGGKVVSLTRRLPLPPGNTPGTHFC